MKSSRLSRLLKTQHAGDGFHSASGNLVADDAASSSDSCSDYNTNGNVTPAVLDLDSCDAEYVPITDNDNIFQPTPEVSFLHNGIHLSLPIGRGLGDDISQNSNSTAAPLLVRRHHSGGNSIEDECVTGNGIGRVGDEEDEYASRDGAGSRSRDVTLKRRVGLFSGVALIVGTMIGSGIFVSPGQLLQRTGSVSTSLLVWVACGVLSLLGGMAYGELGTMLPYAGGEYFYYLTAFGSFPGFMYCWVSVIILKPAMMGIVCLTFSSYAVKGFLSAPPVDGCVGHVDHGDENAAASKILGVITIAFITFINCYNVKLATNVQNFFTGAKLLAIAIIICGGLWKIGEGNYENLKPDFEKTEDIGQLASAFYSGLWAYDGWNNLNYVAEEVENPYVNLPKAIVLALPLVIVCYVLVNVAYLSVMSAAQITSSSAVAVEFGELVLGRFAWIMPLAVVLSTFGAANGTEFTAGRLAYSAARERHMVDFLSYVNVKSHAPAPALIFNSIIAAVMIGAGDIGSLIDFFSFTAWIFYGGAMVALIVMRRTKRDHPRPYKVHILIPITVAVISVYLVIGPIVHDPKLEYMYAMAFIAAGALVYVPFVHYRYVLPGMDRLTILAQLLLQVVPTSDSGAASSI